MTYSGSVRPRRAASSDSSFSRFSGRSTVERVLATNRPGDASGENMPQTGAELVRYWETEGLIGARSRSGDSPELARELHRRAERRLRD
jgi:hypothetical protein